MRSVLPVQKAFISVVTSISIIIFFTPAQVLSDTSLTIKNKIPVPPGYQCMVYPHDSFSSWIQNLPLKTGNSIIDYCGHNVESGFYNVFGVIMIPLMFKSDLEQCADFAMRFWAEFHKEKGKLDKLFLFDYSGQKKMFSQSSKTYQNFLKAAFANTNSHSLKKGCIPVAPDDLMPGDFFVQNERGGVGHVSVIMDICHAPDGKRLFLMGYSFMPAQEFHIEKAEDEYGINGWFTLEGYKQYLRDHLDYGEPVLRRFPQ
jgi:hypothetical protein